jgi:levansucrase
LASSSEHVGVSTWRLAGAVAVSSNQRIPIIRANDLHHLVPSHDLWDMWPLQEEDGTTALIGGRAFWFFLSSPKLPDPEQRHDHARIRMLGLRGSQWSDYGLVFSDGFGPGTREWSGSAVLSQNQQLRMFFTASGRREGGPRFEQRIFEANARFEVGADHVAVGEWTAPREIFSADDLYYATADDSEPVNGMIRGFRDPSYFRDPADGAEYIFFTGSAAATKEIFDGVIGVARFEGGSWQVLPPVIDAQGINKELERPHVIVRGGVYYLFWSTHAARFAPGITAPTGLYGMMATSIEGPWQPMNGTGLVAANPPEEPIQAYCWWVTSDLSVISFANYWGLAGQNLIAGSKLARTHFGGTVAPTFRINIDRARSQVAPVKGEARTLRDASNAELPLELFVDPSNPYDDRSGM